MPLSPISIILCLKKSMLLSLLCLIGLRRNQIERDTGGPGPFPRRRAERGGGGGVGGPSWGSGKDGECVCMWVHVCVSVCVCFTVITCVQNACVSGQEGAPAAPPCCCSVLHATSGPQSLKYVVQRASGGRSALEGWKKSVCMFVWLGTEPQYFCP